LKRIIALITVCAFAVALAGMVYAQVDTRTPEEKLAAGRDYLKLLDQKIIRHRNLGNTATVTKLQAEKKSTIARMQVWKAEAEAAEAAPPPPPPPPPRPVAPPPPPPPPAPSGMFGWGLMSSADIGYITGDSKTASFLAGGSIILDDPMAMGTILGLSADAVNYKVGLGLTYGKDRNDNTFNAILVTFDGILNLPEDVLGIESYTGAQVNYPVYKSDVTGAIGGLLYFGIKGDIGLGLGGKSYAELGYGAIRRDGYSTKGVDIKFGQEILL
jgi:hypothetical protein